MIQEASILAIHKLLERLITSIKDRKVASELREIQAAIFSFCTSYYEARERNIELLAETVRLQQAVSDTRPSHAKAVSDTRTSHAQAITDLTKTHAAQIAALNQAHAEEIAKLQETIRHLEACNRNEGFQV